MKGSLLRASFAVLAVVGLLACGGGDDAAGGGGSYLGTCHLSGDGEGCMDFYAAASASYSNSLLESAAESGCTGETGGTFNNTKCDGAQYAGGCQYESVGYYYVLYSASMTEESCTQSSGVEWISGSGEDGDATDDTENDDNEDTDEADGDTNIEGSLVGSCDYEGYFCNEFYSVGFTAEVASQVCQQFSISFTTEACDRTNSWGGCIMPSGQQVMWYSKDDYASLEAAQLLCGDYTWINP